MNLRNYDRYFLILENYARANGVTIEYRDEPGSGAWVPSRRKIVLDPGLSQSFEIAVLLHELGHLLDDTLFDKKREAKLDKAYGADHGGSATASQRALILLCEERAWNFGRGVAKKLRIRLGKWYDKAVAESLQSYRNA